MESHKMDNEKQEAGYQSPDILVHSFVLEGGLLTSSDNGEMHNGGFLDE